MSRERKERKKVELKFSFKVQVTHISFSKNSSDLDEDFDDGLDGARADPSLDCTFSMDRVHDRVGIVRAVSLSQTLYRRNDDEEEKKNSLSFHVAQIRESEKSCVCTYYEVE